MTEVCSRVLKAGGPALLFEKPKGHVIPVLGNLFGTTRRVALAMGAEPGAEPRERCAISESCWRSLGNQSRQGISRRARALDSRSENK